MRLIFRIPNGFGGSYYVAAKTPREALRFLDERLNQKGANAESGRLIDWPDDYGQRGIEIVGAADIPGGILEGV